VLIVEDSGPCAATLELALQDLAGLSVAVTRSAEEALRIMEGDRGGTIRALVTDVRLPRMDGLELVERVRRLRPRGRLPIIVTTGESDPSLPDRARRAGADACFRKPYSPAELRRILEEQLNANPSDEEND
jgi:CheY-like chemotaxis protein